MNKETRDRGPEKRREGKAMDEQRSKSDQQRMDHAPSIRNGAPAGFIPLSTLAPLQHGKGGEDSFARKRERGESAKGDGKETDLGAAPVLSSPSVPFALSPLSRIRAKESPPPPSNPQLAPAANADGGFDLEAIRKRLANARGPKYWRSLEELADTEEFQRYLEREFPHQAPRDMAPLNRREFFRVMGATLALAGVGGCSYQPAERIVPYVEQPEELLPGKPLFYTTTFQRGGYAYGLLGESHMGRPIKLEGNPDHPASLGATDIFAQASLLQLYDPDRSQAVRRMGDLTTWDEFLGWLMDQLDTLRGTGGAGLRVLTETVTSPTMAAQLRKLLATYPRAKLCQYDPVGRESVREGTRLAFGEELNPVYHFDRAERILSLDSNFLMDEPGSVRYARDFIDGRRVRHDQLQMNRLYVAESTVSITGAKADHRLALKPSQIEPLARALAAALGANAGGGETASPQGVPAGWIDAVKKDLQDHRGKSLVIAGPHQSPRVHALAHAMNQALGSIGQTVTFTEPVEAHFGARESTLRELVDEMKGGQVGLLVVLGGNPVYTAPADLGFADAFQKVAQRVHLGLYEDETAVLCHWHIPESHYLEAWSDARAFDGTASIVQPLITPLYSTRSAHELLAAVLGQGDRAGYDIVREYWQGTNPSFALPSAAAGGRTAAAARTGGGAEAVGPGPNAPAAALAGAQPVNPAYEKFWQQVLVDGSIRNTAARPKTPTLKGGAVPAGNAAAGQGMEIVFRPDPTVWDGRFANNGWLQELPKPLSQLTWDNAALISPATAAAQHLESKDWVNLTYQGRSLRVPIWVVPGHPDDTVTLTLGYGRERAGRVGTGTGFNASLLRTADAPWFGSGLQLAPAGGRYNLVTTQHHHLLKAVPNDGDEAKTRGLVREGTLEEFAKNPRRPEFMQAHGEEGEYSSLYPPMWPSDRKGVDRGASVNDGVGHYEAKGYDNRPIPAWGMVIDLNACIGCNACMLACQSENNIATVGKDQVAMHRMMHWIRVDTYFAGDPAHPDMVFEPVPCMHCENAPCEPVCPVEATSHSAEGINEQTYNRCVGTRYCQNNCPYKVRRFNYFQYSDQKTPTIQMMQNPDVTVRSRGVMEKCTYCVQRINEGRIQAEREDREIRDGDVVTACAQVCPTQAIIFGNINDATSNGRHGSRVRQLKLEPLNYALLTELNTFPRTSYLANLRNPNPELKA
jgi:MoCo/4Fe-4S cofactor protein with predicted Tat translocation signal